MVNMRRYIHPFAGVSNILPSGVNILSSAQVHHIYLRSRLYSVQKSKGLQISVPTRSKFPARQGGSRYPLAESVLDDALIQPYVHDCLVCVREGDSIHRFRVYFKNHCRLPTNKSIPHISRGDIIVMRAGIVHPTSVVNMHGRDTIIADWMVPR